MDELTVSLRKQHRTDAAQKASKIIDLHRRNKAITELQIAERLGLTEYGVRWLLMDRGFEPRYISPQERRKRELEGLSQRVAHLYRSGMSLREIAVQFDVSRETVRNMLKRRRVRLRAVGRWHKPKPGLQACG